MSRFYLLLFIAVLFCGACIETQVFSPGGERDLTSLMENDTIVDNSEDGCPGVRYLPLEESPYVLPYSVGESHPTGLTNCSSSFHSADRNDNLAFDFDMPLGATFTAIRAGTVEKVVEDQSSSGGDGAGNYVVINHGDNTFGLYYHSPFNGISVDVGQSVAQGQELGEVGRSGYAGYAHLHLIVTANNHVWPYRGLGISFKNASPRHQVLKTGFRSGYEALPY